MKKTNTLTFIFILFFSISYAQNPAKISEEKMEKLDIIHAMLSKPATDINLKHDLMLVVDSDYKIVDSRAINKRSDKVDEIQYWVKMVDMQGNYLSESWTASKDVYLQIVNQPDRLKSSKDLFRTADGKD